MKVVCFGLLIMLVAAVTYIWILKNSPSGEAEFADFGCGLLAFFGGGLVLVGLEGMLWA